MCRAIAARPLNVCLSGALGAVGRELVAPILAADDLVLQSAVARREIGRDIGEALGSESAGVVIDEDIESALDRHPDVLVDYTHPTVVRRHVALALERERAGRDRHDGPVRRRFRRDRRPGARRRRRRRNRELLSHRGASAALAPIAARHVPSFEVIEHGAAAKPDVPSGTARRARRGALA